MTTKTVTLRQFGTEFRRDFRNMAIDVERGLTRAALRGVAPVATDTPSMDGTARAGWAVRRSPHGAELYNDTPHAGILEEGSRPHMPPIMPILRWVVGKWGADLEGGKKNIESLEDASKEARSVAWGVAKQIAREGTKANHMVLDNLDTLAGFAKDEVEKILKRGQ